MRKLFMEIKKLPSKIYPIGDNGEVIEKGFILQAATANEEGYFIEDSELVKKIDHQQNEWVDINEAIEITKYSISSIRRKVRERGFKKKKIGKSVYYLKKEIITIKKRNNP